VREWGRGKGEERGQTNILSFFVFEVLFGYDFEFLTLREMEG